jgi:hypothetical protein
MTDAPQPLLNLKTEGIIVLLTAIFHLMFTVILRDFVPTESSLWKWVWAFFSATPLTGTFFLASNMFTMVLVDQLRRKNPESGLE